MFAVKAGRGSILAAPKGYDGAAMDPWAIRVRRWSLREAIDDLPPRLPVVPWQPRDCFMYGIGGDKIRDPDSARALL